MILVAIAIVEDEPKIIFWTADYKAMDAWLQDNRDQYKIIKTVNFKEPEDAAKI